MQICLQLLWLFMKDFTYSPDEAIFWKQAKGTEESYLYVTTNHIDDNYLAAINSTMSEDEHLLIACVVRRINPK